MRLVLLLTMLFVSTQISNPLFAKATVESVKPFEALRMLKNGNLRFQKSNLRKDGASKADVTRLSSGQKPHTIVLSCSDSRVPPELVFDQKLGEIFVVRTAGQSLGDNAIGSIEYAVEHLGAKNILVMGHSSCGAVKAAHSTLDGASAGSTSLDALVKDIHPRISKFKSQKPSADYIKEGWANIEGVARDLTSRSKIIAHEWSTGQLIIVPALYDLKTGVVSFREPVLRTPADTENTH